MLIALFGQLSVAFREVLEAAIVMIVVLCDCYGLILLGNRRESAQKD